MIDRYKNRDGKLFIISEMKDDHLLNAYRYFSIKRKDFEVDGAPGKIIFDISLLIGSLWQEIDKRELLKY